MRIPFHNHDYDYDYDYDEIQGKSTACIPDLEQKFIATKINLLIDK